MAPFQPVQLAEAKTPAPPITAVHPQVGSMGKRIYDYSQRLDVVLGRLRGSQPVGAETTANTANNREPSTMEFLCACHAGLDRLEFQLAELEQLIG